MKPLLEFGIFTDAHTASGATMDRDHAGSPVKIRDCLSILNREGIDWTVNLGDLVDRSAAESMGAEARHLEALLPILARFNGRLTHVLGNHDLSGMTKQDFLERIGAPVCQSFFAFDVQSVRCMVLDGNFNADGSDFAPGNQDWANAWMAINELAWLRNELNTARNRPVIVFCHENIEPRTVNNRPDPHVLRNAAAIRSLFAAHGNIRAVFQGHYHPGTSVVHDGIPYITMTSMVTGSGPDDNAFGIASVWHDGTISIRGFGRQPDIVLPS